MEKRGATVVNLTPHALTIILSNSEKLIVPSSGIVARASTSYEEIEPLKLDGHTVPVSRVIHGPIKFFNRDGKPVSVEEVKKVIAGAETIVVPQLLASYTQELKKLLGVSRVLAPDTARALRDEQGKIIGVPGFIELG
jgi:hypothetical protein